MSSRAITIAGFLVALAAAIGLEVTGRWRPTSRHRAFGVVLARVTARAPGRVAVMLVWWWLGWHFFAR